MIGYECIVFSRFPCCTSRGIGYFFGDTFIDAMFAFSYNGVLPFLVAYN